MVKNGTYTLTNAELTAYRLRYPNFDEQLPAMAFWLVANPASRPVRVSRFVQNWMKKHPANVIAIGRKSVIAGLTGSQVTIDMAA